MKTLLSNSHLKEKITIDKTYFDQLKDDSFFLNCLRNAGVNNWEGWDYACEEYEESEEITEEKLEENK